MKKQNKSKKELGNFIDKSSQACVHVDYMDLGVGK